MGMAPSTREAAERLKVQREALRGVVGEFRKKAETQEGCDELRKMKAELEVMDQEIQQILSGQELAADIKESRLFGLDLLEKIANLEKKMPKETHSRGQGGQRTATSPPVELFTGRDPRAWLMWQERFTREVRNDDGLSEQQKFELLLAWLRRGSPAHALASSYAGVPTAYTLAWAALEKRFEDKAKLRSIIVRELQSVRQTTVVTQWCGVTALRDKLVSIVSRLTALGESQTAYKGMALSAEVDWLPEDIRARYIRGREQETEEKRYEEFIEFLDEEIEVREELRATGKKVECRRSARPGGRGRGQRARLGGWSRGGANLVEGDGGFLNEDGGQTTEPRCQ